MYRKYKWNLKAETIYSTEDNIFSTIYFVLLLKPPTPEFFKDLLHLEDQLHLCEGRALMDVTWIGRLCSP